MLLKINKLIIIGALPEGLTEEFSVLLFIVQDNRRITRFPLAWAAKQPPNSLHHQTRLTYDQA